MQIMKLTKREIEILKLVAQGLTYQEVADKLGNKRSTIGNQMRTIILKLGVRNQMQAVKAFEKKEKQ